MFCGSCCWRRSSRRVLASQVEVEGKVWRWTGIPLPACVHCVKTTPVACTPNLRAPDPISTDAPPDQEPTKHQYDFDAATTIAFLLKHGLEKDYKV